jgi:hypothetical protein
MTGSHNSNVPDLVFLLPGIVFLGLAALLPALFPGVVANWAAVVSLVVAGVFAVSYLRAQLRHRGKRE